ncbi:hypothetical protein [Gemmobacter sp.]|uniref:hypothetical protein n=1 Tax=Gemmobacter sp. TaxID=1898957 RepID=UPI002AFF8173|nr:hypothetical protein [Gemmobacter sp.]
MTALIWIGAAMTGVGLAGIIWCIVTVARARKAGLDDAGIRTVLRRVVAVNLGAFALSALGLGAVVAGLLLG